MSCNENTNLTSTYVSRHAGRMDGGDGRKDCIRIPLARQIATASALYVKITRVNVNI